MADVFLSYARQDADTARRFAEAFEAGGFSVWWDDSLRSGETFDEAIELALREAKSVVVLWSPSSVASRWVRAKAAQADRNRTTCLISRLQGARMKPGRGTLNMGRLPRED